LCYSPEFIALGTVIRDFLNPDFYLVGQFDDRSGEALEFINSRIAINKAPCARMSIENAELAKIAVNSYVTMKISFANMLSDICEKIPGGNIDVVSNALGMDTRIGRKYLTGGFGFGGPCFPRDNVALSFFGEKLGVDCSLTRANHAFNKAISQRSIAKLKEFLDKSKTVCVLGLAYKPLSHVIEESPGIFLCRELANSGFRVVAYDPLANNSARTVLGNDVLIMDDLQDCLSQGEIFIITTTDASFKALSVDDISLGRKITIIDFWRSMDNSFGFDSRINYVPIGRCVDSNKASKNLAHIWVDN
jgi:UDPglucose 6-dehydrogenase